MRKITGYFQKIGKSLMLPVAVLPVCAILMGVGYLLCPGAMQGTEISGVVEKIGYYMVTAGGALINNMSVLFVLGVSLGMSNDNHGAACFAGFVSWLIITTMLNPSTVGTMLPAMVDTDAEVLAFSKIQNPFIGILSGIIGAECYNHNKSMVLPDALAFFSGRRFVSIITAGVSLLVSAVLLLLWPLLFSVLVAFGELMVKMKGYGVGLYVFSNRLLIPSGLHHALNNVFWFDTIGIGDLTNYWAGKTSADVSWSLGMYMSCFFPCFMGGIQGASLAMYHTAKNKKKAKSLLFPSALGAFICGITEPFEFSFMFSAFPLYVVYAVLCGIVGFITYITGFRAGFAFSAGATDILFSSSLPAAQRVWLIIPLGIFAFVLFYIVFRIVIVKFDCKTPGREDDNDEEAAANSENAKNPSVGALGDQAKAIIDSVGGIRNIDNIDCCATRLRIKLQDSSLVNKNKAKDAGALAVNIISDTDTQLIIGPKVQQLYESINQLLNSSYSDTESQPIQHTTVHHGDKISIADDEPEFDYVIQDSLGIHARPAKKLVTFANKYDADILLTANNKTAHADSISELLSLGAEHNSVLHVSATGPDRNTALRDIKVFFNEHL